MKSRKWRVGARKAKWRGVWQNAKPLHARWREERAAYQAFGDRVLARTIGWFSDPLRGP